MDEAQVQLEQIEALRLKLEANDGSLDRDAEALLDRWVASPSSFGSDAVRAAATRLLNALGRHRCRSSIRPTAEGASPFAG